MYIAIVAAHVILSLLLILIVIIQPGKGGDFGAAFGGAGGSTIFGPRGPTGALQQLTTAIAVLFMCTSIALAYLSNEALLSGSGDVLEEIERKAAERAANEAASRAEAEAALEAAEASLEAGEGPGAGGASDAVVIEGADGG